MRRAIQLVTILLLAASCNSGDKAMERTYIRPGGADSGRPYSGAIVAGNTLYVSGQIGIDPATGELVPGGIEAETAQVLANLKAIIVEAGFAMEDVVKCTVLLDTITYYGPMNAVYSTWFPENPPVRKAFAVEALPRGAAVEIDALAVRGTPSSRELGTTE